MYTIVATLVFFVSTLGGSTEATMASEFSEQTVVISGCGGVLC